VFCLGKGLGGGMPMSACVGSKEVMDAWQWSADVGGEAIHTATHFGNPVACACSIATLDVVVGQKLFERSQSEGDWLLSELSKLAESTPAAGIKSVRGKGLMIGIEVAGGASRGLALMRDLLSNGYIVLTGGDGSVITLTPPLNIARPLLAGFIETFGDLARLRPVT
jgi:4-aminobutyrate aminotransferase/(S)-3-amino-2-methylpropionate transaminase